MNEEKQEDRFHNESIKVRFCPRVVPNRSVDYKTMTYGETYKILEKRDAPSGVSSYLIKNDYGNKVWINEDHFESAKEPTLRCETLYEEDDLASLSAAMKEAAAKPVDLDISEEANILSGTDIFSSTTPPPCCPARPDDRKIFSDVHAEDAILDNIDEVWKSIHKVFPDLAEEAGCHSVRTKNIYELMHERMAARGEFVFTTEGYVEQHNQQRFLCVNGMVTKITTESIDTAFRGLKAIIGEKKANKVIASVICKKLESIF